MVYSVDKMFLSIDNVLESCKKVSRNKLTIGLCALVIPVGIFFYTNKNSNSPSLSSQKIEESSMQFDTPYVSLDTNVYSLDVHVMDVEDSSDISEVTVNLKLLGKIGRAHV